MPTPLTEAEPRSLDELYSADPLSLTDDDIDKMVADLREKRKLWAKEESASKTEGRARRPSAYKDAPETGKISLGDLGLLKKKESSDGSA